MGAMLRAVSPNKSKPHDGPYWPGETRARQVRISDALWNAAKTKADAEGVVLADVIRGLLSDWVGDPTIKSTEDSKHDPRKRDNGNGE